MKVPFINKGLSVGQEDIYAGVSSEGDAIPGARALNSREG